MSVSRSRLRWAFAATIVCLALSAVPVASARRRATASEARSVWQTVERLDGVGRCVRHTPRIATVRTPGYRYAMAEVYDKQCGDGVFILRRRTHGSWLMMIAGGDIVAPFRCADDLRKVPRRPLADLFGMRSWSC
jgi:hypothetical protein